MFSRFQQNDDETVNGYGFKYTEGVNAPSILGASQFVLAYDDDTNRFNFQFHNYFLGIINVPSESAIISPIRARLPELWPVQNSQKVQGNELNYGVLGKYEHVSGILFRPELCEAVSDSTNSCKF